MYTYYTCNAVTPCTRWVCESIHVHKGWKMGIGSCGWLELAAAEDVRYVHLHYMQGMHLMYDI